MENYQKVDFSLENPETCAFYFTEKGYLRYDRFTRSFYDNDGSYIKVKYFFRELKSFDDLSKAMIKYLCEKHHPNVMVSITPTNAQLFEGIKSTGEVLEFITD